MTDHIDTSLLESAILSPDALGKESLARIRGHLDGCALCREQFESLSRMYQVVENELKAPRLNAIDMPPIESFLEAW